jgi:transcriptional regulator with XRE-family HTH domain
MKTWNERLRFALSKRGKNASELARATGTKPASVKDWLEKPNMKIGAINALTACDFLKINIRWLLHGTLPSGINELDSDLRLPYVPVTQEAEQSARIVDSIESEWKRGKAVKIVTEVAEPEGNHNEGNGNSATQ